MKKIGIATYHFADSYGAVLQCCALHHVINEFDDCEAEVINYVPQVAKLPQSWNNQYYKYLFQKKREKFQTFLRKYVSLEAKTMDRITAKGFDYCCVGSDQVWNMNFSISSEYFLPHVEDETHLVSYAASIGILPSHRAFDRDKIKKYVSRFENISVREEAHVQIIEELCKKKCECVLDPTLLLPVGFYKKLTEEVRGEEEAYVLFFWLQEDSNLIWGADFANMIARKLGIKVIHSLPKDDRFMFDKKQKNMAYAGIEEFLWYIQNAEFVVTNSYHATIFSIIFQRPFYSYNTIRSRKSRFDTLSKKIGIQERFVDKTMFPSELQVEMDFGRIEEHIYRERKKSMDYLKYALDI